MAEDPRYRTKYYLDYHWIASNATDDDGNSLGIQTMYAYPDYPLELELKAPSVIDIIITIDQPESEARVGHDHTPYGYRERMPMEIISVDKTSVTATKAMWQAEAEMRRILETYPTGSLRRIERTSPATKRLGSTILWSAKYVWTYTRDTT